MKKIFIIFLTFFSLSLSLLFFAVHKIESAKIEKKNNYPKPLCFSLKLN